MSDKPEKIKPEELRVEILSEYNSDQIKGFKSYERDLVDFLLEDALENQKKNVSVTYLWVHIKSGELVGYITLLTDSVTLKKLDPSLKEEFKMKGIDYPTLPAIKIGRICVDDRYRHRGIGTMMFYYALSVMVKLNKIVGCRFITLDAKENKDNEENNSVHFYKGLGFNFLKEKEKRHPPMYFDAFKTMKEIEEKLMNK